jgi:hypothetical protein
MDWHFREVAAQNKTHKIDEMRLAIENIVETLIFGTMTLTHIRL